jgi:hypothetical protein
VAKQPSGEMIERLVGRHQDQIEIRHSFASLRT